MSKKEVVLMEDTERQYVRKANELLTSKYQMSLFGNKIIAISLTKVHMENEQVISVLTPSDIKLVLGNPKDTNIYHRIKNVSENLAGNVVTIEDRNRRGFRTFAMITNVEYQNRELRITYNKEMTPYINELTSGGYTTFELGTLVSFDKNSSYRLYEILKKHSYRLQRENLKFVVKTYGFSELKAMIGLINVDAPHIRKAISEGRSWDDIVENVCHKSDRQYDRFNDFERRVLSVAQYEMKEKSDIQFEYAPVKVGKGGRISAIQFTIYPNTAAKEREKTKAAISRIEKLNANDKQTKNYNAVLACLKKAGVNNTRSFTKAYFSKLFADADNDIQVIYDAIEYGKTVSYIRNYFGWLKEAVRYRYAEADSVEVADGSEDCAEAIKELRDESNLGDDIWSRYKKKDDFNEFLDAYGFSVEELEAAYSTKELVKLYIDYKVGR